MEINTARVNREPDAPAVSVPPDRSRAARKKTIQKIPRPGHLAARLLTWLKALAVIGALGLAAVAASFAYRHASTSDALALRNISIEGCRHSDPAALESIIRQSFPANVLRIDLSRLRARLEQETWIRKAEVRRVLPGNLQVYLQERIPSVIAEMGGELVLLDNEGVILDRYDSSYGKLDVPVFRGLKGDSVDACKVYQEENAPRVKLGIQVLTELERGSPELVRSISEMDLADTSNVKILLMDDTAEIVLGDRDYLNRLEGFVTEYAKAKAKLGEIERADLRFYPSIVYQVKDIAGQSVAAGAGGKTTIRN